MPSIQIPTRLNDVLATADELHACVRRSLVELTPFLDSGKAELPLFPEYTDHGLGHTFTVLTTISSLIPEPAWPLLSAEDAAVLVLATILHDSAIHLTEDGFLDLLSDSGQQLLLAEFKDLPWIECWEVFFAAARRWDARELKNILGDVRTGRKARDSDPEDLVSYIRRPSQMGDPDRWPRRYRKFLGEFLRRHHGRLAHQIAIFGVPGPGTDKLHLQGVPDYIADLAGLVARSHTVELRDTFGYLEKQYHGRVTCRGTHPIWLMALLRVADYLDIKSQRAPNSILAIRRLRSPMSIGEWSVHRAIVDVNPDEHDREGIFVVAEPRDVATFRKVRKLLRRLQQELDVSWAVLGEVYSKQDDLNLHQLGLGLRRIRSSIDDIDAFAKTVRYYPVHAAFETSDADLLKLLVVPLYGDRPEIGIRELMQNAVDAVRELREYYVDTRGDRKQAPWPILSEGDPDADVVIAVCRRAQGNRSASAVPRDWSYWVEVSDRGIGMTPGTVCDYYLKAGACFRNSDAWKRHFADDHGRSKVIRSGRFGVGVLATFLLGDRILVSTRHVSSEEGLRFEAGIDDTDVDLLKVARDSIGTCVYVRLDPKTYHRLTRGAGKDSWDWYCCDDPRVVRVLKPQNQALGQGAHVPSPNDAPLGGWRGLRHKRYLQVDWTYNEAAPGLCCNGIVVQPRWSVTTTLPRDFDPYLTVRSPKFSVFDPDGALPLDITRSSLQANVLCSDREVLADVFRDFSAFMLVHAPRFSFDPRSRNASYEARYASITEEPSQAIGNANCWISTRQGTVYIHPWHLAKSDIRRLLICFRADGQSEHRWAGMPSSKISPSTGVVGILDPAKPFLEGALHGALMASPFMDVLPVVGVRVSVSESCLKQLTSCAPTGAQKKVRPIQSSGPWRVFEQGSPLAMDREIRSVLDKAKTKSEKASHPFFVEVFLPAKKPVPQASPLGRLWDRLCMGPPIPYTAEDREKKYKQAFHALRDYMNLWRIPL